MVTIPRRCRESRSRRELWSCVVETEEAVTLMYVTRKPSGYYLVKSERKDGKPCQSHLGALGPDDEVPCLRLCRICSDRGIPREEMVDALLKKGLTVAGPQPLVALDLSSSRQPGLGPRQRKWMTKVVEVGPSLSSPNDFELASESLPSLIDQITNLSRAHNHCPPDQSCSRRTVLIRYPGPQDLLEDRDFFPHLYKLSAPPICLMLPKF